MKTPHLLVCLLLSGALAQTSIAATRNWTSPADGPFDGSGHLWNTVPGANDVARFADYAAGSAFTVRLTQNTSNQYIRLDGNGPFEVTLDLNGFTYQTTGDGSNDNVIGRNSQNQNALVVTGGGTFSAQGLVVGSAAQSNARLTLKGHTTLTTASETLIGNSGSGRLEILEGSVYESATTVRVARRDSAVGSVLVSGGGQWKAAGEIFFAGAAGARSDLTIESGGQLATTSQGTNGAINLGQVAETTTTVLVTGEGSRLSSSGALNLGGSRSGAGGTTTLTVSDEGTVSATTTLMLYSKATLTIEEGKVTTRDFGTATEGVSGTINLTLGSSAEPALLSASRDVFLASGTLNLLLGEGIDYNLDDVIRLIGYSGTLSGTFSNLEEGQLLSLGDRQFIFSYAMGAPGASFIGLTVIPEPRAAVMALVGLASASLFGLRARRSLRSKTASRCHALLPFLPLPLFLAGSPALVAETGAGARIYVSPGGRSDADGTRENPVSTPQEGVALLPEGGTLVLKKGIYRQTLRLSATSSTPAPLVIQGEEGAIFDGGAALKEWRQEEKNLYSAPLPEGSTRAALHLWDRARRIRLTRVLDEAAVRAWPSAFCVRGDGRIFMHLPEGETPGATIECSLSSKGIVILRPGIILRGIHFRNFFGDQYSAAIDVGAVRDVEIEQCRMENIAKGVSIVARAEEIRILRCDIRDVATGIASSGDAVTVADTIIEAASGSFAVHDLLNVLNCGIRLYFPGLGATVRGNVTGGFQYGLRIKTGQKMPREKERKPFLIEHNTFSDGMSVTLGSVTELGPQDRFAKNIVAYREEDKIIFNHFKDQSVVVEGNYLFAPGVSPGYIGTGEGAQTGPEPFIDMLGGDLRLQPTMNLPLKTGASIVKVEWRNRDTFQKSNAPVARKTAGASPVQRRDLKPLDIYVRADADAEQADGTAASPYPSLQPALDQAEPGDVIHVAAGIYMSPAVLTRSGTPSAPIVIRGEGNQTTFFDGGRRVPVLLSLQGVQHVRVENIQFRWFAEAGLKVENSKSATITQCRFLNAEADGKGAVIGFGVFMEKSPRCTISHCITVRNRVGFKLVASPQVVIEHNTGFKNLNTALEMVRSAYKSVIRHNSFGYSSHAAIYLWEPDAAALKSLECDYNNYAMRLPDGEGKGAGIGRGRGNYGPVAVGKAVVDLLDAAVDNRPRTRYADLRTWQKSSGKDQHSVFVDPMYAAPLEGDFRLLEGSPNRLSGPGFIGACGSVATR